jgi:hypothetical protein
VIFVISMIVNFRFSLETARGHCSRLRVCVVHGGVTIWWKRLSPWSNRSFQTNLNSQSSLIALRAMRAAPLALQVLRAFVHNILCFCRDSRSMYV